MLIINLCLFFVCLIELQIMVIISKVVSESAISYQHFTSTIITINTLLKSKILNYASSLKLSLYHYHYYKLDYRNHRIV